MILIFYICIIISKLGIKKVVKLKLMDNIQIEEKERMKLREKQKKCKKIKVNTS